MALTDIRSIIYEWVETREIKNCGRGDREDLAEKISDFIMQNFNPKNEKDYPYWNFGIRDYD